jgi:hypothetical protein
MVLPALHAFVAEHRPQRPHDPHAFALRPHHGTDVLVGGQGFVLQRREQPWAPRSRRSDTAVQMSRMVGSGFAEQPRLASAG